MSVLLLNLVLLFHSMLTVLLFLRFFLFFFVLFCCCCCFHSLAHGEADDVGERVSVINSLDFKKCNDPAPRVVLPEFSCMQFVAVVSVQTIESFSIR